MYLGAVVICQLATGVPQQWQANEIKLKIFLVFSWLSPVRHAINIPQHLTSYQQYIIQYISCTLDLTNDKIITLIVLSPIFQYPVLKSHQELWDRSFRCYYNIHVCLHSVFMCIKNPWKFCLFTAVHRYVGMHAGVCMMNILYIFIDLWLAVCTVYNYTCIFLRRDV